jgi:transposase-like protein
MLYWDRQEGLVMTAYTEPRFNNDDAARVYLERTLWPDGTVCPHCGVVAHSYPTKRAGVYRCAEAACRKDFTVTMRTVMERSKIALHKWVLGFAFYTASKKGFSAHQLHRTLGVTYRSAWFMAHRIRESMRDGGLEPIGGDGKIVEADETYFGKQENPVPPNSVRAVPIFTKAAVPLASAPLSR